jgi:hypothetical protein
MLTWEQARLLVGVLVSNFQADFESSKNIGRFPVFSSVLDVDRPTIDLLGIDFVASKILGLFKMFICSLLLLPVVHFLLHFGFVSKTRCSCPINIFLFELIIENKIMNETYTRLFSLF